jgi:hypothetical protein
MIGDSTAIRFAKRWRETGRFEAKSDKSQSARHSQTNSRGRLQ